MIGDFLETSVTFNHRSATLRWLESPVKRPVCECFVCLFVCYFFIPRTPPLPNHKHTTSTNPHTPAHHVTSQTRTPPKKKTHTYANANTPADVPLPVQLWQAPVLSVGGVRAD